MFAVVVKPVQQLPPALPLVVFDLGGAVSFAGRDMSDAVLALGMNSDGTCLSILTSPTAGWVGVFTNGGVTSASLR